MEAGASVQTAVLGPPPNDCYYKLPHFRIRAPGSRTLLRNPSCKRRRRDFAALRAAVVSPAKSTDIKEVRIKVQGINAEALNALCFCTVV